jgi:hypothetical protein
MSDRTGKYFVGSLASCLIPIILVHLLIVHDIYGTYA